MVGLCVSSLVVGQAENNSKCDKAVGDVVERLREGGVIGDVRVSTLPPWHATDIQEVKNVE